MALYPARMAACVALRSIKYCSTKRACLLVRSGMREYLANEERFWTYVRRGEGCWLWTGATDHAGYGRFHVLRDGKNGTMLAHRLSFAFANGYLPTCVCHHCDNPSCVRPDHLFPGTWRDNSVDMVRKGRHAVARGTHRALQGDEHHQAKLREVDIPVIRACYAKGNITQRALAKRYGVSQRAIARIVLGIGWTHV